MNKRLAFSALTMLLLAALYTVGCDSAPNPIAPDGTALSISANPARIAVSGESAMITVIGFRPDGNPLNSDTQLSVSTTLGVLRTTNSPSGPTANIVRVNGNGRAVFFLFGDGRQGNAMVTASLTLSGGGTSGGSGGGGGGGGGDGGGVTTTDTSASISILVGEDANTQPTVTVTANPTAIALNGSSTITVTAKNADQSPLAGGTAIVRTSLGSLSFDNGNTTDSNGVVTLTLTSSQSGQAEVTATVGSSAEAMATVEIGTTRKPVVSLNANPSTLDTEAASLITVTARDESGNLLGNLDAIMTSDLGALSGSNYNPSTDILRLSGGRGQVTYTAGTLPGMGTVTAFVQNSDIVSLDLTIRGRPARVSLRATPGNVPATGDVTIEVMATVTDDDANLLGGESVTFGAFRLRNPDESPDTPNNRESLGALTFNPNPAFTNQSTGVASSSVDIDVDVDLDGVEADSNGNRFFFIEASVPLGDGSGEQITNAIQININ